MVNPNIQTLRTTALAGLAAVLLVDVALSLRPRAGLTLGGAMLLVLPISVALVSLVLMPDVVGKLLAWLAAAPGFGALLTPSIPLHLLNLSFGLSMSLLLHIGPRGHQDRDRPTIAARVAASPVPASTARVISNAANHCHE